MAEVSLKGLLEAGVHFGHQVSRWDPRMKSFIFSARAGIHIIDLEQTVPLLIKAYNFIVDQVSRGGTVLFVGTKPQARDVIEEEARRVGMPFVAHRWLGGMLTNYNTIKQSIDKLKKYYERVESGEIAKLRKKEQLQLSREAEKMERSLGGIKDMNGVPAVVVLVDPSKEHIAMAESRRLGIPIVALTDTNCNPANIDFLIPGNDDAMRSIKLIVSHLADACVLGGEKRQAIISKEVAAKQLAAAAKKAPTGSVERTMDGKGRSYTSKLTDEEKAIVDKDKNKGKKKFGSAS